MSSKCSVYIAFMCYEWKFKVKNVCSMEVQRINEQMWENDNQ